MLDCLCTATLRPALLVLRRAVRSDRSRSGVGLVLREWGFQDSGPHVQALHPNNDPEHKMLWRDKPPALPSHKMCEELHHRNSRLSTGECRFLEEISRGRNGQRMLWRERAGQRASPVRPTSSLTGERHSQAPKESSCHPRIRDASHHSDRSRHSPLLGAPYVERPVGRKGNNPVSFRWISHVDLGKARRGPWCPGAGPTGMTRQRSRSSPGGRVGSDDAPGAANPHR
jgi:hypothetical protein